MKVGNPMFCRARTCRTRRNGRPHAGSGVWDGFLVGKGCGPWDDRRAQARVYPRDYIPMVGIPMTMPEKDRNFRKMTARFDGRCAYRCGNPILAGTPIVFAVVERNAVHLDCCPFKDEVA